MKTIPDILRDAAELFESRNKEYGNAYKTHSQIMFLMLGKIKLESVEDYEEFFNIGRIIAKLNRAAKNFPHGHHDSYRDLVVYSAMAQETYECKEDAKS